MNEQSRYALLSRLSEQSGSEDRRDLLRQVTDALSHQGRAPTPEEFKQLDQVLSAAAQDFAVEVKTEFARLVAASATHFCQTGEQFALDEIEVARPILSSNLPLSEDVLLRVCNERSQDHMLAITQRAAISERVSHALVERGGEQVVCSLLSNEGAQIGEGTYEVVAQRAENAPSLQGQLIKRQGVPLDILNGLYHSVEAQLRSEILRKFEKVSPAELDRAFERGRNRGIKNYRQVPEDFAKATLRVQSLKGLGRLQPPMLASLLREGQSTRTAFKIALAQLTDVPFDVADASVENFDLDTLSLICRGARFDRGLFVTLAIGLDQKDRGLAAAEEFGSVYESVTIEAAQRALRFWKIRAA